MLPAAALEVATVAGRYAARQRARRARGAVPARQVWYSGGHRKMSRGDAAMLICRRRPAANAAVDASAITPHVTGGDCPPSSSSFLLFLLFLLPIPLLDWYNI